MDPWKPIRLWLCIGAIFAFLAVGTYARLVWGVPWAPYGWWTIYSSEGEIIGTRPRRTNPLEQIEHDIALGRLRQDWWWREVHEGRD